MIIRQYIGILFLILALLVHVSIAGPVQSGEGNIYQDLQVLKQALYIIHSNYHEEISSSDMVHDILENYSGKLDRHSQFIRPRDRESFDIAITGRYGGIGAYISLNENGRVIIETPMDNSPAQKSGLRPNDVILSIDGLDTEGMALDEAADRLKGIAGTTVVVTVGRGDREPFKINITREVIRLPSARDDYFEEYDIAYLRLGAFVENTPNEVREKINGLLENEGVQELVIDLRYNGGGILSTAVELAGFFLPRGSTVVSTRGRVPATWKKYITRSNPVFPDIPLVILINEGSASASEILAGAIRDHGRGVLMGTPSFGKGSVQEIFPLRDGSELKITVAHYYTPSGIDIQKQGGIKPDIFIEIPSPDRMAREEDQKPDEDQDSEPEKTEAEEVVPVPDEDQELDSKEPGVDKQDHNETDDGPEPEYTVPPTRDEQAQEWKDNLEKYDPQLHRVLQIIRANRILYRRRNVQ